MTIIDTGTFFVELTVPSVLLFKKTDHEGDATYGVHLNNVNIGCWYMRYDYGSEINISCILGLKFWWANL